MNGELIHAHISFHAIVAKWLTVFQNQQQTQSTRQTKARRMQEQSVNVERIITVYKCAAFRLPSNQLYTEILLCFLGLSQQ